MSKRTVLIFSLLLVAGCNHPKLGAALSLCEGRTCSGHGQCSDETGIAVCRCDTDYQPQGTDCVANDACTGVTCAGHGTCAVTDGAAACTCEKGYQPSGLDCAVVDSSHPCAGVTCSWHGACDMSQNEPVCVCNHGYHASGTDCVPDLANPCDGVTCSGHGACSAEGGVARCHCAAGYLERNLGCIERPAPVCTETCTQDTDCRTMGMGGASLCRDVAGAKRCVGCTADADCRPLGSLPAVACESNAQCGDFGKCMQVDADRRFCMPVPLAGHCSADLTPMTLPLADGSGDAQVCGSTTAVCDSASNICTAPLRECDDDGQCLARATSSSTCATDGDCPGVSRCVRLSATVNACQLPPREGQCAGTEQRVFRVPSMGGDPVEVCYDTLISSIRCVAKRCVLDCNDGICGAIGKSYGMPVCSTQSGLCVCTADSQCAALPSTPVCNTETGACECTSDAQCQNSPGQPFCVRGQCSCGEASTCASLPKRFDSTVPACLTQPDINLPSDLTSVF